MGHVTEHRAAVERVVRDHAGWVFATARRRVGDAALAEDVAQAVFLLYWRKGAGIGSDGKLAGWLHRAVRYCSANALRLKDIRERHEREAAMERKEAQPAEWGEVESELEGAMDRLSEKDRQAVVLRFYRGLSLREVGAALGLGEDAARMRVERAVEKLRGNLAAKGVEAQTLSLSGLILAHAAEGGPAGLVERITAGIGQGMGGSTAGGIAQGAGKMMVVWAKVKVAAGILLGLGLVAGVVGAAQGKGPGAPAVATSMPSPAPLPAPELAASRTAGERVLVFPAGVTLGTVYVREDRGYEYGYVAPGWEFLAPAEGDVRVAAGKQVELRVSAEGLGQLSALATMPADAFYSVSLALTTADDAAVAEVARLTGLRSFNASMTRITDRAGVSLKKLTALEDLNLTQTGAGAECMAATEAMANLRHLAASETQVQTGLRHLAGKKHLRFLDLARTQTGDADLAVLGELPELKWLRLLDTRVTDRGLRQVAKWRSLETLDLWATAVGDDGMAALSDLPGLKELRIADTKVTDAGMGDVAAIRTLEKLTLPGRMRGMSGGITNAGLEALAGHPKLKEIQGIGLDDAALGILAEMPALESMTLAGEGITDAGMGHVAEMRSLRTLMLGEGVGDAGFAKLASLGALERLYILEGTQITAEGLAPLRSLKELQVLNICESRLVRGGVRYAAELPKLQGLALQGRNMALDDAVMEDVGKLAALESLTVIDGMPSAQVTDEGIAQLAKLARLRFLLWVTPGRLTDRSLIALSKLEELSSVQLQCGLADDGLRAPAGHGRFTDEGLRALAGRPKLRILMIPGTFSEAAKAELRRKTPSLQRLDVLDR